jgi:molybdate transport system ATP-binding protein
LVGAAVELKCWCRKRYASGFAVEAGLTIPLEESPVTVLFGPSGSGKTTVLRLLAGLEQPDAGSIWFGGRLWHDSEQGISLPPQQRRAGFLFQDYALFPHLTVAGNVGFAATRERAQRVLEAFDLTALAGRMPRALSGGQQQRVALARALAADPALLLLDEPLSALDAAARVRLRQELRRLLVDARVPAIVVTHDRREAMALGDWMAVVIEGSVRQVGPMREVFRHPADSRVAESVGVENVLPAEVVGREGGLLTVQVGPWTLDCVESAVNGAAYACIRAEDVAISPGAPAVSSARNRIPGRIRSLTLEGPLARVELDCGFPLVAVVTAQSAGELGFEPGDEVCAVIKATAVQVTGAGG